VGSSPGSCRLRAAKIATEACVPSSGAGHVHRHRKVAGDLQHAAPAQGFALTASEFSGASSC
jgi:hypothetical protein